MRDQMSRDHHEPTIQKRRWKDSLRDTATAKQLEQTNQGTMSGE